jgi:3-oxoacyl-[acyl-carrier-protein] synthase II
LKQVAVTGYEIITPFGRLEDSWTQICKGVSSVGETKYKDTELLNTKVSSEISPDFISQSAFNKKYSRLDPIHCLGLEAAKGAIEMSGVLNRYEAEDIGVIMGSMTCGLHSASKVEAHFQKEEYRKIVPSYALQMTRNALSGQIAIEFGLKGPNLTLSTACSSGGQAIMNAFNLVRYGQAKAVVVGGVDLIPSMGVLKAYDNLRVMATTDVPRPFSKDRTGFAFGEGAGVLVIERKEDALEREAPILGEIKGAASTCDAYTMAIPDESGETIALTMEKALKDASIAAESIDYINAHATGTKVGDIAETRGIKKIMENVDSEAAISSIKGATGHTLGAAGAIEAIICLLSIKHNIIPPTVHYLGEDEELDLDYTPNYSVEKQVSYALSNSFGFGGNNVSIVLGR